MEGDLMFTNIRTAHINDAPAIARIHIAGWHTTYKNIIPNDYLAALSYEGYLTKWETILTDEQTGRIQQTWVAENAEQGVIGFISGGVNRDKVYSYEAELYAIYLRQDIQQKGLGSQLVLILVQWLIEQHYKTMMVWALEKNSAGKFYEVLGGKLLPHREIVTFAGKELIEVAYTWDSLPHLLNLLQRRQLK